MNLEQLPQAILLSIEGLNYESDTIGRSYDSTYAILDRGHPRYYLKSGPVGHRIEAEHDRLKWLRGKLPVPEIICFESDGTNDYLLITALPGHIACHESFLNTKREVVTTLAQALKLVHSIDSADCPFDCTLQRQIEEATKNTLTGIVDEDDFDTRRLGRSAEDILEELVRTQPHAVENVFTHGDFSLPNILLDPVTLSPGFIDLGRAGVSDRYTDLAIATRSITYNFGAGYEKLFLKEYGLESVDRDRIEFYRLLDEFF